MVYLRSMYIKWPASFTVAFLLLFPLSSNAQNPVSIGLSVQWYPAGLIPSIYSDLPTGPKTSVWLRAGWNIIDRQDFSDYHDHEEGNGVGVSFGLRKHFPFQKGQLFAGLNNDIWYETIDWIDDHGIVEETGTTKVLVVQPWLETGYLFGAPSSKIAFGPTIGFGREINASTDGEEVGRGWIFSASVNIQMRLN